MHHSIKACAALRTFTGVWAARALAALAASALACGDSGDGGGAASCGVFAACGGDPTGTWRAQAACVPSGVVSNLATALPEECQDGIVLDDAVSDSTLTIGADGAFSEQGTATLSWSMSFDAACVTAALPEGVEVDDAVLATFCDGLEGSITGADAPFEQASCDVVDGVCECTAQQVEPIDQSGQLTVEGNQLVYAEGQRQDFCANGDELQLAALADTAIEGAHLVYVRAAP